MKWTAGGGGREERGLRGWAHSMNIGSWRPSRDKGEVKGEQSEECCRYVLSLCPIRLYIYMCVCVCVCLAVCMWGTFAYRCVCSEGCVHGMCIFFGKKARTTF